MSRIAPIPTTRIGSFFIRQRLTSQMQFDQLELLRLQTQISTGRRLQLASDDTPAAMRAINLQRVLDRKGQIQTNVHASNLFLGEAERRLGDVTQDIHKLKAEVIGIIPSIGTEQARQNLASEIGEYLNKFMAAGNGKTLSRFLFSGSRQLIEPYAFNGEYVEYRGNNGTLRSYVDIERLFDTNLSGADVFGGISTPVQGSVDLDPQLTEDTLLGAINGGEGITRGGAISIAINTGPTTVTSVVELDGAVTIGDVMRLIEDGAPDGTDIDVSIVGGGLEITTPSGTVTVREVAEGRTARELGIFTSPSLPPTSTVNGADLEPILLNTTRLDEILGGALDTTSGIIVTNGGNSVTLDISAAETVDDLLNLFNGAGLGLVAEINEAGNGINVRSRLSGADLTIGENGGTTATQLGIRTYTGETALAGFNRGVGVPTTADLETLDTSQLDNLTITARDGTTLNVNVSTATSLQDVVDLINAPPNFTGTTAVTASLNASGNGIDLADASTNTNGSLTVQTSLAAVYFGFVSAGQTEHTSTLTNSTGDHVLSGSNVLGNDLLIETRDGTQLWIDLAGAETVDDVIDRINTAAGLAGVSFTAQLATTGNGIQLVDGSTGAGTLTVRLLEGSQAAEYLGFVAAGSVESDPSDVQVDGLGNQVLTSEDRHTLEADSLFNTLLRLRTALLAGDEEEIGRSVERLDADFARVNFAQAELGTRLQSLTAIGNQLQDEDVQLRSALSQEVDADIIEAISNLTARQYAFEASLRTTASVLQLSLLDYI
jgi:flagellar hook-associated protein 3 FlgL